MTDAEFIFRTDCAEKKKIGHGYSHKNRTGKGPVKFPSDYLSKKEKIALNGELMSYSMNDFYTWDEFRRMPEHIQVEYLQHIVDKYHLGFTSISKLMFSKSKNTLHNYIIDHKLNKKGLIGVGKGHRDNDNDMLRLLSDMEAAVKQVDPEPIVDICEEEAPVMMESEEIEEAKPEKPTLNRISFEMNGWDYMLLDMVSKSFGDKAVRVSITVEEV